MRTPLDRINVVPTGVGHKHCKFVSSDASQDIALTKGVSKDVCSLYEGVVSFLMTESYPGNPVAASPKARYSVSEMS